MLMQEAAIKHSLEEGRPVIYISYSMLIKYEQKTKCKSSDDDTSRSQTDCLIKFKPNFHIIHLLFIYFDIYLLRGQKHFEVLNLAS